MDDMQQSGNDYGKRPGRLFGYFDTVCRIPDCPEPVWPSLSSGLCNRHYQRNLTGRMQPDGSLEPVTTPIICKACGASFRPLHSAGNSRWCSDCRPEQYQLIAQDNRRGIHRRDRTPAERARTACMKTLLSQGLTCLQIAKLHGISKSLVSYLTHGVSRQKLCTSCRLQLSIHYAEVNRPLGVDAAMVTDDKCQRQLDRYSEISALRAEGLTLAKIGALYRVSREQIRQILKYSPDRLQAASCNCPPPQPIRCRCHEYIDAEPPALRRTRTGSRRAPLVLSPEAIAAAAVASAQMALFKEKQRVGQVVIAAGLRQSCT